MAGKAGTIFALDAFGIHAGNKMVDKFRLVTWFRYGMVPNLATVQNKISSWELNDSSAAA